MNNIQSMELPELCKLLSDGLRAETELEAMVGILELEEALDHCNWEAFDKLMRMAAVRINTLFDTSDECQADAYSEMQATLVRLSVRRRSKMAGGR